MLGPFFKDISSEIDGEDGSGTRLCGCVKVGMETGCSSGQKGEFSSVENISGRGQSIIRVCEDGSRDRGICPRGILKMLW